MCYIRKNGFNLPNYIRLGVNFEFYMKINMQSKQAFNVKATMYN